MQDFVTTDCPVRTMYDHFETSDPSSNVSYKNLYLDAQYKIKLSDKFRLTPRIQYLNQRPWQYDYPETPGIDFEVKALRTLGQLEGDYDISRKVNLNFGALYFTDKSVDLSVDETMLKLNNVSSLCASLIKTSVSQCNRRFQIRKK